MTTPYNAAYIMPFKMSAETTSATPSSIPPATRTATPRPRPTARLSQAFPQRFAAQEPSTPASRTAAPTIRTSSNPTSNVAVATPNNSLTNSPSTRPIVAPIATLRRQVDRNLTAIRSAPPPNRPATMPTAITSTNTKAAVTITPMPRQPIPTPNKVPPICFVREYAGPLLARLFRGLAIILAATPIESASAVIVVALMVAVSLALTNGVKIRTLAEHPISPMIVFSPRLAIRATPILTNRLAITLKAIPSRDVPRAHGTNPAGTQKNRMPMAQAGNSSRSNAGLRIWEGRNSERQKSGGKVGSTRER